MVKGVARPQLSLKGRALRLLSQREHSRAELERKLARHLQEGEDLAAVLDDLQAKGFICEARVLASVLHLRAPRLGGARLRQELAAKGLDAARVREALAELAPTEPDRAQALWERRFGAAPTDAREWARQARFLAARGFAAEIVRRVVPPAPR
ncbi:recombination regulator RecX [Simplicispira suum]|uniref:Regulatory protein RecX n=1 Tax=Simplicispira suum TaxID=2109915 RepID=A0A2S0N044_9BURK|nr:recombination regulator RecX [Simplicispira suum]